MIRLAEVVAAIQPPDEAAMVRARAHQADLTKPPGSLGRLEELAIRLAGIRGRDGVPLGPAAVVVCAADHGVTAEGVSAYPAEVTPQMVLNFLAGGAAINVLARQAGARVVVVDVGVAGDLPPHADLVSARVRHGSGNIACEPAMSREEAALAISAGIEVASRLASEGIEAIAVGEMGIGNTTAASAVVAAACEAEPAEVVGRGTGVDDAGLARKLAAVAAALRRASVDPADGVALLAELGGLEIGAIAGVVLGAAAHRRVCILDGHPATAGALIAALLAPRATAYLIAGHRSAEPGHRLALARLGLLPLLDLDLRLGEGTGAALALHLVRAAALLPAEMATISSAGVRGAATADLDGAAAAGAAG